ncbi:hypothetical protein FDENT_4512 [Fusarium denticulatum]|uniref:Uncharacterized protein n=1 Tax=Fusarium denticulatum TaxID=48507 RepID=A0A8H5XBF7_9HYPO|nr:hypothetical protein FDENT_4512 [Fusarium denticulatum]
MRRRNCNTRRDATPEESHRKGVNCSTLHTLVESLQDLWEYISKAHLTSISDNQLATPKFPTSTPYETFLGFFVETERRIAASHRRNSHPDLSELSQVHISIDEHFEITDKFQQYLMGLGSAQKRMNDSIAKRIEEALSEVKDICAKIECDEIERHMLRGTVRNQSKQLQKVEAERSEEVERRLKAEEDRKVAEQLCEKQREQLSIVKKDLDRLKRISDAATHREGKLKIELKDKKAETKELQWEMQVKQSQMNIMRDVMKVLAKHAHFGHEKHTVGDPSTWTPEMVTTFFSEWEDMNEFLERRREVFYLLSNVLELDAEKVSTLDVNEVRLLLEENGWKSYRA